MQLNIVPISEMKIDPYLKGFNFNFESRSMVKMED